MHAGSCAARPGIGVAEAEKVLLSTHVFAMTWRWRRRQWRGEDGGGGGGAEAADAADAAEAERVAQAAEAEAAAGGGEAEGQTGVEQQSMAKRPHPLLPPHTISGFSSGGDMAMIHLVRAMCCALLT